MEEGNSRKVKFAKPIKLLLILLLKLLLVIVAVVIFLLSALVIYDRNFSNKYFHERFSSEQEMRDFVSEIPTSEVYLFDYPVEWNEYDDFYIIGRKRGLRKLTKNRVLSFWGYTINGNYDDEEKNIRVETHYSAHSRLGRNVDGKLTVSQYPYKTEYFAERVFADTECLVSLGKNDAMKELVFVYMFMLEDQYYRIAFWVGYDDEDMVESIKEDYYEKFSEIVEFAIRNKEKV